MPQCRSWTEPLLASLRIIAAYWNRNGDCIFAAILPLCFDTASTDAVLSFFVLFIHAPLSSPTAPNATSSFESLQATRLTVFRVTC